MKGTVADIMFAMIILLAFATITIFSYAIWTPLQDNVETTLQEQYGSVNNYTNRSLTATNNFLLNMDYIFIFIAIATLGSTIIGAFYINSHPVFFIASLLVFVFVIVMAGVLGNVFFEFQTAQGVQDAASNYGLTEAFFQNLPLLAAVFGAILIIVMLGKTRSGGNYYG